MNTPTPALLQHVSALASTTSFQALMEHLRKSHEAALENVVNARRTKDMRVYQGRARELAELIQLVDDAPRQLKAIERQQQISPEHLT